MHLLSEALWLHDRNRRPLVLSCSHRDHTHSEKDGCTHRQEYGEHNVLHNVVVQRRRNEQPANVRRRLADGQLSCAKRGECKGERA